MANRGPAAGVTAHTPRPAFGFASARGLSEARRSIASIQRLAADLQAQIAATNSAALPQEFRSPAMKEAAELVRLANSIGAWIAPPPRAGGKP